MQWFQIQEQMKSDVLFLDCVIFRIRKSDNTRVLSGAISKHPKADNTQGTRLEWSLKISERSNKFMRSYTRPKLQKNFWMKKVENEKALYL